MPSRRAVPPRRVGGPRRARARPPPLRGGSIRAMGARTRAGKPRCARTARRSLDVGVRSGNLRARPEAPRRGRASGEGGRHFRREAAQGNKIVLPGQGPPRGGVSRLERRGSLRTEVAEDDSARRTPARSRGRRRFRTRRRGTGDSYRPRGSDGAQVAGPVRRAPTVLRDTPTTRPRDPTQPSYRGPRSTV
jgi:hypothetical protein